MIDDLTSCSSPSRTAGTSAQPGRAATARGLNFLPHHDPKIMSGARRTTSSGSAMMRSRPSDCCASSGKHVVAARDADQLRHPADAGDLRLVPLLEIDARPARQARGGGADRIESGCRLPRERRRLRLAADHPAQRRITRRMSSMLRWLKTCTSMPRRTSSAAMSAWRSEKPRTRSGSSARIRSIFALVNAETPASPCERAADAP